ncbi:MAG: tetratricopeptide repeat protein [Alphaproteobacteria bacterium]
MRKLCLAIVIAIAITGPRHAGADQNDPRLDNLFLILQSSEEEIEIRAAENLIWTTWIAHENSENTRLMYMGIKAMADRRFDDAVELYTALIDQAPDYAEAWNKRATVYFIQGKLALSSADVEQTLALEPRHFGALSGLGQIEMLRGNGDAALQAFEDAVKVHPRMAGMHDLIRDLKQRVRGQEL